MPGIPAEMKSVAQSVTGLETKQVLCRRTNACPVSQQKRNRYRAIENGVEYRIENRVEDGIGSGIEDGVESGIEDGIGSESGNEKPDLCVACIPGDPAEAGSKTEPKTEPETKAELCVAA